MNKAHQEKPVESNRATGHALDRGVEKNTEGLGKNL
jgi:hypothetical protein